MIRFLLLFIITLFSWSPFLWGQVLQPIGGWSDHLPYNSAVSISGNGAIITAAAPSGIFQIDNNENSIWRKSKISGLSSSDIKTLSVDPISGDIIIVYVTGIIDIVSGETVHNIDDIPNSNINPAPALYSINIHGTLAYISASYGISVVDIIKKEIKETYIIGKDGSTTSVFATAAYDNRLFAATAEGLKSASLSSTNIQDYTNWKMESGQNGLPAGPVQHIVASSQDLLLSINNTILSFSDNNWKEIYKSEVRITGIVVKENEWMVTETNGISGKVVIMQPGGAITNTLQHDTYTGHPLEVYKSGQEYWIADSLAGVTMYDGNSFTSYNPGSPAGIAFGEIMYARQQIFAVSGSGINKYKATHNDAGIFIYKDRNWINFTKHTLPALQEIHDLGALAYDVVNDQIWAGSLGDGLIKFNNHQSITQYKENSFIDPSAFAPSAYNVSALEFDADNNLWISNYGADQCIVVRKPDGIIEKFRPPFALNQNAVGDIVIDDAKQIWIIAPNGNGLLILHYGNDLQNKNDDQWRLLKQGVGAGNLPTNDVLSIVKDNNGFIWIGTSSGIGIIQCPEQIFTSQGCEAMLPVIQQGNFAGYLFKGETVQAIAVDGANRKWIGTKNGVWLISEDGEQTIERFTTLNSPLIDNDVRNISIDRTTGEVYFATSKGICSYRGTSTGVEEERSGVLAFPNPVPPGYEGTVAIRGLPMNSIVKITELDGRLVYQTRALGGQAIWDGKNYKGQKVNTAIYLVFARSSDGKETLVTKIAFIHK